jgi:hypothetical protein
LIAVLVAAVMLSAHAAAEEPLYPHAEQEFGPWGYIDKTGNIVIPLQFDWAEPFSEDRAAVVRGKKYGFIDPTGREVIPLRLDVSLSPPHPFEGGWASVREDKQWRLIEAGIKSGMPTRIALSQGNSGPA